MYQNFIIDKQSNTYSETLEAFGVANLIDKILEKSNTKLRKTTIEDKGLYYLVTSNKEITSEMIDRLDYFQVFKFLVKDDKTIIPNDIGTNYFNYPAQKVMADDLKNQKADVGKIKDAKQKKVEYKKIKEYYESEFGNKIDKEYDIYRELVRNPYVSFNNLYNNFYENKSNFSLLISTLLNHYSKIKSKKLDFKLIDEKPTSQQLLNPNQGKGLNKSKANNSSMGNLKSNWISETMKISGALEMMSIQYVKVGSSYDLKIYVPEFKNTQLSFATTLVLEFKRTLKSNSPTKLDILNSIDFTIKFIENSTEYNKGKVRNTINGFHSVYQKDLGQNKAVANIAFLKTPDFVEYSNQKEANEWKEILENQRKIISNIEELGDSVQGLQNYRNFLGSDENSALEYFSKFSYWYATYLMQSFNNNNNFTKPFKIETLTKFYTYMDSNLSEIITNEGFLAVAKAIRNSTIRLQITSKFQKNHNKFKIKTRYGVAQQLQNKSKSKNDLATFVGEFITLYNSETAMGVERNEGKFKIEDGQFFRANVRDEELLDFYGLLDKHPSRLIGALLASYGFALRKSNNPNEKDDQNENEEETEN